MDDIRAAMMTTQSGLAYAFLASTLVIFVFPVCDLIGPSVFANLLLGIYHRPIRAERIFLFNDVTGSTAFADRHGDLVARDYLGRIFGALAPPVCRSGGSIYDYVGDSAFGSSGRRGLPDQPTPGA